MNNFGVNVVQDSFADFTNLCFSCIDEAACRVLIKIWFVKASRLALVLIPSSRCNFFEGDFASSSMEFATLGFTFLKVVVMFLQDNKN